jgi:hypothetical protein
MLRVGTAAAVSLAVERSSGHSLALQLLQLAADCHYIEAEALGVGFALAADFLDDEIGPHGFIPP